METKTKEQIEELRISWINDPCWDIEDTEGFEEHRDELRLIHLEQKLIWSDQRKSDIAFHAKRMGTYNEKLIYYLKSLEGEIDRLNSRIDDLQGAVL